MRISKICLKIGKEKKDERWDQQGLNIHLTKAIE